MHTRKIGMNKGARRIWLQNGELTDHGIKHGDRFDVYPGDNELLIKINPEGKRKIAGKPGREIIDMAGKVVTSSFDDDVDTFQIIGQNFAGQIAILLKAVKS